MPASPLVHAALERSDGEAGAPVAVVWLPGRRAAAGRP